MKDYAEGRGYLNGAWDFILHPTKTLMFPHWGWAIVLGLALAGAVRFAYADSFKARDGSVALVRHQAKCDDADIAAHILRLGGGRAPREVQESHADLRRARLALLLDRG